MKRELKRYFVRLVVYAIPLLFISRAVRMHHDSAGHYNLTAFGTRVLSWEEKSVTRYNN